MNTLVCPVRVKLLHPVWGGETPRYATAHAAAFDLRAAIDAPVSVEPGGRVPVPTGIAVEPLVPGVAGLLLSRSGLGAREGLTVAQGVGLIDPDYRGEITVYLLNTSGERRTVEPGERIAQLMFVPFARAELSVCEELAETGRGCGGFGHTGSH